MQEDWNQWNPIPGLSKKYYLDLIFYTRSELIIILEDQKNENNKAKILFYKSVKSYKYADETFTLNHTVLRDEQYGTSFYSEWTFFKVQNSDYLKWVEDESLNHSTNLNFLHFSFITPLEVIDVISIAEPHIELYKNEV